MEAPETAGSAPTGHYPSLEKCNLESWEETAFALGNAVASEQGKKQWKTGWGSWCSLENYCLFASLNL